MPSLLGRAEPRETAAGRCPALVPQLPGAHSHLTPRPASLAQPLRWSQGVAKGCHLKRQDRVRNWDPRD